MVGRGCRKRTSHQLFFWQNLQVEEAAASGGKGLKMEDWTSAGGGVC